MFPFLCLGHGSSPFVKFGNEPGVQNLEISQAGSSQRKQRLRVTSVMAHGPGIKLLDGLAEASTIGKTDLRLPLPSPILYMTAGTELDQSKVPYCYGAGQQDSSEYSLAKEGWTRHQVNGPVPLTGADGVVRSNSKQFLLNEPPRLRPLRWLRDILLMGAATPPFPRRGIRFKPTLSTTKCVYFPGFVPVLGTSEDSGTQSYTCWA